MDQKQVDPKEKFTPKQNELLLSKDGTPGIALKLENELKQINSAGILRGTPKIDINLDYLSLVLNSPVVYHQIYRNSTGSIILHWKKDQIENTLIPILDPKTQT